MEIVTKQEGTPYVLALVGRLDTNTSPQLESFANELYGKGISDIVVDMSQCEFVSSAGLRVIVAMQKHAAVSGTLVFKNVIPEVMDVFEMTGFDKILTIE
ncbi:MAG: STAS domain-containing protein [Eggerthellaceae bacterium]|nr:STAS domain-containing protein [Eggerthellaceae bacterium]